MNKQKEKRIQKKLKDSCVGIAGLGGLGSNVTISLARSGVGKFVLVDYDIVEEANLNRQYYFIDQIGKLKTIALKENIERISTSTTIKLHHLKLEKGRMDKPFRNVDVVIEALDSAEAKTNFIEEILIKLPEKPIIAASGVAGYGHSERILTQKFGNLILVHDNYAKSSEEDILLAPRVCLFANWEANLAIEILLGEDI